MKVGLVLECGKDGPDEKVCRHMIRRLDEALKVDCAPMGSKRALMDSCGEAAAALLASGSDHVVVVWDMNPPWDESAGGCLKSERDAVLKSVVKAGVSRDDVDLVAVHMMLEAWLLTDERAISELLSTSAHPVSVNRVKRTERLADPKARLISLFEEHRGRSNRYRDMIHAIQLAELMPDLQRIRRCDSFARFADKAANVSL